ncbi:hypothetical protein SO694_001030101 [Aureococcus anophagefferens]|uniref:Helicase C-terminal domain-containing protein n=1 Tax=Aureococcus anophagefferens TaxID=44056 RepID=A0ABR1FN70_AURAN
MRRTRRGPRREKLRRSPDALASWLAEHTDEHWRAPPVDGDGGALDFSRALYDLRPLGAAWPLDAKVREEALDGSPAVDAGGTCAPDGEHRLFLRLRETLAVPGRAMELEPVVRAFAGDLARRLDDDEADALAEMLERFPDRLLEAHLPPYWSDAQAAYRYQYAVAKSGIFDHVGTRSAARSACASAHGERNETKRTRLWFCTTGYLVRLVASYPGALANTHLIIDEVHGRASTTEILVLLARRLVESHPSLKLVLMSATVCVDLYAGYFDVDVARAAIHVGGATPVDIFYAGGVAERLRLPRSAAGKLAQETAPSTPGRRDKTPNQSTQHKVVAEIVRAVGTAGDVPFEDQLAVFWRAGGTRPSVILATNAAESGVTIPDCDHVIDLGLAKQIVYNAASHRSLLSQAWISAKSPAVQFWAAAGRVRGHVYRRYAKERYDALDEHATSEIHRCPLDATVAKLFPPGVDYAFASGVRRVHDERRAERCGRHRRGARGRRGRARAPAEGRLVDVAFCELAADVAYAVTARGLALFLTAAGRLAAGDLVARLVAKGAGRRRLGVRRRDGGRDDDEFRRRAQVHPSAGEKKDLKALLDACAAVARPSGAASVSVRNVGLEKTVVSSSGVDLAPSLLARLFGAPEHARSTSSSDAIFGLEGAVPTRGADDEEEEEEDDEEPRPSPATPAILARKRPASPARSGARSPRTAAPVPKNGAPVAKNGAPAPAPAKKNGGPAKAGKKSGRSPRRGGARGRPGPQGQGRAAAAAAAEGRRLGALVLPREAVAGRQAAARSWVEGRRESAPAFHGQRGRASERPQAPPRVRDAEIRAGWVEAGRRNLATGWRRAP